MVSYISSPDINILLYHPGSYRIALQAVSANGIASVQVCLEVLFRPLFLYSAWCYVPAALRSLLLVLLGVRYYIRRKRPCLKKN